MNVEGSRINSITLTGAGKSFGVAEFGLRWGLGNIPVLACTLATGAALDGGDPVKWEGYDPDTEWTLEMDSDEFKGELFKGVVSSVSTRMSPSTVKGSAAISLTLSGSASRMRQLSSSRYTYISRNVDVTADRAGRPVIQAGKQALFSTVANLMTGAENVKRIQELTGYSGIDLSSRDDLGKFAVAMAAMLHDGLTGGEVLDPPISSYFDTSDKVAFRPDAVGTATTDKTFGFLITKGMVEAYYGALQGASMWDALQAALGKFFLTTVPTLDSKIRILPIAGWLDAEETLDMEYVLATHGSSSPKRYTPDMVEVVSALPSRSNAVKKVKGSPVFIGLYPDLDTIDGTGVLRKARVVLPSWAAVHLRREFGNRASDDKKKGSRTKDGETPDKTKADTASAESKLGDICSNYAKAYFAKAANAQATMELSVYWGRFDEYVGRLGKVAKITIPQSTYIGGPITRYGMIESVALDGRLSGDGGSMTTVVSLGHVRDEAVNKKWALKEHPFYTVTSSKVASTG